MDSDKEKNMVNVLTGIKDDINKPESVEQLVRTCLDRIAEREPVVRAWAWHDEKRSPHQGHHRHG